MLPFLYLALIAVVQFFALAPPVMAEKLSEGCANPSWDQTYWQSVSGKKLIFSAPKYDAKRPHKLIVSLHGANMNAQWMKDLSGGVEGFSSDAIFTYLEAGKQTWNWGDAYLIDNVIDQMGKKYCVDLYQVFVIGYSNGAFFTNMIGQRKADKIKAIIAVAGGGGGGPMIPAMIVHGRSDQYVSFGSGFQAMRNWATSDKCVLPKSDDGHVGCQYLPMCAMQVVWCPWNGTHDWPNWLHKDVWQFIDNVSKY
jgi:poly(3-hydroxybutyrate) depolymerase